DVARSDQRLAARLLDLSGDLVELVDRARHEGDGDTARPELQGDLATDAAAAARDQRDLTGEVLAPSHPPIWLMDFCGFRKPSWLIRCPSSFCQIAPSITPARWSSDAPPRIRSRSGVSRSEKRQVRSPPSAVRRMRLQLVQKACDTEEMKPIPPWAPSANRKSVDGPGLSSATGTRGKRSSIRSWIWRLGTTRSLDQRFSPSRGMNSM